MKKDLNLLSVGIFCIILLIILNTGCSLRPFYKPSGKKIATCKGVMRLTTGEKTRFAFDIFRMQDETLKAFFSAGWRKKYMPVENVSFENGIIHIETESPYHIYEGTLAGDSLTIEGEWNQYKGSFIFELQKKNNTR